MIVRAKEDYRFLLWQPLANFDSLDKALKFLEASNIEPYQTRFSANLELKYTPRKTEEILKKEADVLGLPPPSFKEILDKNPDYFEKSRLGQEIAIKVVGRNLSQEIKEPHQELLGLKEKLKAEMQRWHDTVFEYLKDKRKEIEEIRNRFPIHQALMHMFSVAPYTSEWQKKFQAFTKILQSKKVDINDDAGQTIWHLLVAESQRAEFQGSEQIKRLQDLLFSPDPSKSRFYLIKDKNGNTPLHLAIEFKDPGLTQKLLKVSPSEVWSIKNRDGLTPLGLATYNLLKDHNEEMVKILLTNLESLEAKERVFIFNDEDNSGTTPLERLAIDWQSPFLWKAVALGGDLTHEDSQKRNIEQYVRKASGLSKDTVDDEEQRQEEIRDLLENGTIEGKIDRWISQKKWASLYRIASRENPKEDLQNKIFEAFSKNNQYENLTKIYLLPQTSKELQEKIINFLVEKKAWNNLHTIIMLQDIDSQLIEKIIVGLSKTWEGSQKLKEMYLSSKFSKEIKKHLVQCLIQEKRWNMLIANLRIHLDEIGQSLNKEMIEEMMKNDQDPHYEVPDYFLKLAKDKAMPKDGISLVIDYFLKRSSLKKPNPYFFPNKLQKFLETIPSNERGEILSQTIKKLNQEKNIDALKELKEFALKYPNFKTSVLEAFVKNTKNYKVPTAQIDLAPLANE